MKVFKFFSILALACFVSFAAYGAGNVSDDPGHPANGKDVILEEPGFFDKVFSIFESEKEEPQPPPEKKEEEITAWDACWELVKYGARETGLYLANLGGDLLDIVTIDFSFGNTFAADVHVTNFVDFGVENTDAYFIGYGPFHRYGVGRRQAQRVSALCWSWEDIYVSQVLGTQPSFTLKDNSFNLIRYYTNAYADRNIDIWAVGVRAAMFLGVAIDFHPVEVLDFFCQFANFDYFGGDNWHSLRVYECCDPERGFQCLPGCTCNVKQKGESCLDTRKKSCRCPQRHPWWRLLF